MADTLENIEEKKDNGSLGDLIAQMNIPRIEAGDSDINLDGAPKDLLNPDSDTDNEKNTEASGDEQFYKVPEGVQLQAEFFMESMDWLMASFAAGISGNDNSKYQRSILDPKGFKRQTVLCGALLQKYSIKSSIEAMFIVSILFGYTPIFRKAIKEKKQKLTEKNINNDSKIPSADSVVNSKIEKLA